MENIKLLSEQKRKTWKIETIMRWGSALTITQIAGTNLSKNLRWTTNCPAAICNTWQRGENRGEGGEEGGGAANWQ